MAEFDWAALVGGALQATAIAAGLIFAGRQVRLSTDQNKDAERWRRTEFAASLMERLSQDEELALCARALDWGVGPILVPAKYRVLFAEARGKQIKMTNTAPLPSSLDTAPVAVEIRPRNAAALTPESDHAGRDSAPPGGGGGPIDSDAQFAHDWAKLARAVRPGLDENWDDPRMLVYRYCFDSFGEFLETLQRHVDLGNVDPAHLFGLRYYLDLVVAPTYYWALPEEKRLVGVEAEDVFRPFMKQYYPDGWHLVEHRHRLPSVR